MAVNTMSLDLWADRLEAKLLEFGVEAQVFGGQILPQFMSFHLQLGRGVKVRAVTALADDIAVLFGVQGVLIKHREGAVIVEVPRSEPRSVTVGGILRKLAEAPPAQTALLGLGDNGLPLMLYFPSPKVAHVLVAGMTGSGKSELLRTMIGTLSLWSGRQGRALVYLVDPKGRLSTLAGLPTVDKIYGVKEAPIILETLLAEMARRDAGGYSTPHVYLFIDEVADLMMVSGKVIEGALTRLLQRGRESGIHVIAATQRPSAGVMAGLMKANFPVRISGAVNSAGDASIATGRAQTGAELLMGKGDMLLCQGGRIIRFQVAMLQAGDLGRHLEMEGVDFKRIGSDWPPETLLQSLASRLSIRRPGRPAVPPTEAMISFAMAMIASDGGCSQRALRQWHRREHGSDVNPPRAKEAIRVAREKLALPMTSGALALTGQAQGGME